MQLILAFEMIVYLGFVSCNGNLFPASFIFITLHSGTSVSNLLGLSNTNHTVIIMVRDFSDHHYCSSKSAC